MTPGLLALHARQRMLHQHHRHAAESFFCDESVLALLLGLPTLSWTTSSPSPLQSLPCQPPEQAEGVIISLSQAAIIKCLQRSQGIINEL
jgi:hypothetical protein